MLHLFFTVFHPNEWYYSTESGVCSGQKGFLLLNYRREHEFGNMNFEPNNRGFISR